MGSPIPMASGPTFADVFGLALIFFFCSCISYGVLCAQAYEYYLTYRSDSRMLKAAIAFLMFLETLHVAFTIRALYHFTITVADNPLTVLNLIWDSGAILLVDTFVVLIVQYNYVRTIWILSMKRKALVVILSVVISTRCALELAVMASLWTPRTNFETFPTEHTSTVLYICWLSFGALGDVLISAIMCLYLLSRRTGFKSTDNLLLRVMALTVNSGAITATVAVAGLVTFLVFGSRNLVNTGILVLASGLYANSFFGMLNARQLLRRSIETSNGQISNMTSVIFSPVELDTNNFGFNSSVVSTRTEP